MRNRGGAALAAMLVLGCVLAPGASGALRSSPSGESSDGVAGPGGGAAVLPPLTAGLPPTEKNVQLVGKLELKGHFGNVDPGQIADLSHKGDYAYLNSWQSQSRGRCDRGGVFVVDIKDPANPKEVGFIPSPTGTYPGEGSQVIAVNTPSFKGDLLTINNEACADPASTPATLQGGITLVDVTNPLAPVILAQGFGDTTPSAAIAGVKSSPVHLVHSAFSWQAGQKAYTVMVDNEEPEDVDIVDVTNPRAPQIVNELDLLDPSTQNGTFSGTAFGDNAFLHDMVVKEIDGKQIMLVSYWDAGYGQLDVTDPTNVTVINQSDFATFDPIFPAFSPPEGNAHEAEFSRDNKYVLAADEDFGPFRGRLTSSAGAYNFAEPIDATVPIASLPGGQLVSEQVVFVGRACTVTGTPVPDTVPAAPAPIDTDPNTLRVAVIERGLCLFDEKVHAVEAAGWDAFVIFNNAPRPDGDPLLTNGSIDDPSVPGVANLPGGYITRADAAAGIFGGTPPTAIGTTGSAISVATQFDGWGYMHLFDRATMTELDTYAIPEARDERYALDHSFGDLTVHEAATDPAADLAYFSYYNGGFRVMAFGDGKLTEVGRFVDDRGNNFWGVDVASDKQGGRLILASDRDYGLYVFRYTGPGAVTAPVPPPGPPPPPPVAPPLPPPPPVPPKNEPASFFSFGAGDRLTFRNGKATLRVKLPGKGKVTANLKARIGTKVVILARTTRTATKAASLTLTFRPSTTNMRLLRRSLARRPTRRTSGIAQVSFTPTGGTKRTRNRSLSIAIGR
jgi:hypothetical protein